MSNNRSILSDSDHQSLSLYSADMLLVCRKKMKELEELYKLEQLPFPIQCRTNFRDAWFHYKKVYERFDSIKVQQEQYAMEEHLIRVLKDAITVLFNAYAYWIENVYYLLDEKQTVLKVLQNNDKEDEYYKKCIDIDINVHYWYKAVNDKITGKKDKKDITPEEDAIIKDVTLRLFLERADLNAYRKVLQECMHKIKNYSLRTRLEGIEIYRPENSEEYLDDFSEVFGEMKILLYNHKIYPVIPVFSSFYVHCCYDKCKQCKVVSKKASVISCGEPRCINRSRKTWLDLLKEEVQERG